LFVGLFLVLFNLDGIRCRRKKCKRRKQQQAAASNRPTNPILKLRQVNLSTIVVVVVVVVVVVDWWLFVEDGGVCKFFLARACTFGERCRLSHDAQAGLKMEEDWYVIVIVVAIVFSTCVCVCVE
jgi:hypothetical protein